MSYTVVTRVLIEVVRFALVLVFISAYVQATLFSGTNGTNGWQDAATTLVIGFATFGLNVAASRAIRKARQLDIVGQPVHTGVTPEREGTQ